MVRVVYNVRNQPDGAKHLCEKCLSERGYNMSNYKKAVTSIAWDSGCDNCDYEAPKK